MEPEIPATNGNKRIFLAIAIVVLVAVVMAGYLFIQRDNPVQVPEQVTSTIIKSSEIPRILSSAERALIEERMNASSTLPLTKKESTTIMQKTQNTESFSALTSEEKASLEKRITIQ